MTWRMISSALFLCGVGTVLPMLACGAPDDEPACTDIAVPSVRVRVRTTDQSVPTDVEVKYRRAGTTATEDCVMENATEETWLCGFEVVGDIVVFTESPSYVPARQLVRVAADACHVSTEEVTLFIAPDARAGPSEEGP